MTAPSTFTRTLATAAALIALTLSGVEAQPGADGPNRDQRPHQPPRSRRPAQRITTIEGSFFPDFQPRIPFGRPSVPFVELGRSVLFIAGTPEAGTELWKTDGTAQGTVLVKDIAPGNASSHPDSLTLAGGWLYFRVTRGGHCELWRSNGGAAGTTLVLGLTDCSSFDLVELEGAVYLTACTASACGLYGTDGTTAGTRLIAEGRAQSLKSSGTQLFFAQSDDAAGVNALWTSDGTANGTHLVKDFSPGFGPVSNLVFWESHLYLLADDGVHGLELWKSDGTTEGTTLVRDVVAGPEGSGALLFTARNGLVLILRRGEEAGLELWKSDGTEQGTSLLKDLALEGEDVFFDTFALIDGALFFQTQTPDGGADLWTTDGTPQGTALVKRFSPSPGSWNALDRFIAGEHVLVFTRVFENGSELWRTDGFPESTVTIPASLCGVPSPREGSGGRTAAPAGRRA